jgi:hypothetical protein
MGISCAPDIFQSKIARLLGDLEFVKAYLDDCLIVTKSTVEDHLELQKRILKVNASKSSFAVGELEYLGYVITREGIKPNPKKIQAILNLERPKTKCDVHHLIGLVQYYREITIYIIICT